MSASQTVNPWLRLMTVLATAVALVATAMVGPPVAAAGGGAPTPGESVVAYDDFEGSFPASVWTVGDDNASEGADFWANSSARAGAGSMSVWAAGTGWRPEVDTLFTEGFEGGVLPSGWSAIDDDAGYGHDYWGISTFRVNSGNYSIWCAQFGDNQASEDEKPDDGNGVQVLPNNTDIRRYDSNMNATVSRDVDLTGYAYATLDFSYWLGSQVGNDFFFVIYYTQFQWHFVNALSGSSAGWAQGSVTIPGDASKVGFAFYANDRGTQEGAYVDDVTMRATRHVNNSVSGLYDDGMDAKMTRQVSLAGFETGRLEAQYWLESEAGHDYLQVLYFAGGWQVGQTLDGSSSGWTTFTMAIPVDTTAVGFRFVSDESGRMEGAYLDEVRVVGVVSPLTCSATASVLTGLEAATEFTYRVDVSGGLMPLTWEWNRGDGSTSDQSVVTVTYGEAGSYTASVTVRDSLNQACTVPAPTVVVSHDLSALTVSPSYATVTEGSSMPLSADDSLGHQLALGWSVAPEDCGYVDAEGSSAVFYALSGGGGMSCQVAATFEGHTASATVDVVHDLSALTITPASAQVVEGEARSFSILDTNGHAASGQWSTTCGRLSTDVGQTVMFTALTTGGNTCTLTAEAGTSSVTAVAAVVHDPSELILSPLEGTVYEGASIVFEIEDKFNHPVSAHWSVDPVACGVFNPTTGSLSTFSVATDAGGLSCAVVAQVGTGSVEAVVTVRHDATSGTISPTTGVVVEGEGLEFQALDHHGHAMAASWSVSPTACGAMVPAQGTTSMLETAHDAGGTVCTVSQSSGSLLLHATVAVDHGSAAEVGVQVGSVVAGGTVQATASLSDTAGHALDAAAVAWATTCGAVAPAQGERVTVSAASGSGGSTCAVTATLGDLSRVVEIAVGYAGPFSVRVEPNAITLGPGESVTFTATVLDVEGNEVPGQEIDWVAPCGTIVGTGATVTYTPGPDMGAGECTVQATATVGGTTASGSAALGVASGSDMIMVGAGAAGAAAAGAAAFLLLRRRKQT